MIKIEFQSLKVCKTNFLYLWVHEMVLFKTFYYAIDVYSKYSQVFKKEKTKQLLQLKNFSESFR